ncbi:MAG: T9SS type A sorting domain-containing protein [Bacteroidetes bacterium]|nr:T9SS type A sorting domain-containing protein [Bacteroidota bacterium]
MKKIYTLILLSLFFTASLWSQNLPYLNASTGNLGQSFTDVDTNIYIFHGNRLEKLNKNLNIIWVKTYTNISFNNILLSKTGSMYFIANYPADKIGKLDNNGNVVWVKAITASTITIGSTNYTVSSAQAKQLLLDRNNNLIVTGILSYSSTTGGLFMKLDTLGTILKTRIFNSNVIGIYNTFNVINDSLGHYKIYADGGSLGPYPALIYNYKETADSIKKISAYILYSFSNYWPSTYFYKSKFGSEFYIGTTITNNLGVTHPSLYKFDVNKVIWYYDWSAWAPNNYFNDVKEDEKGNVYFLSDAYPFGNYNKGFIKLDSNGLYNNLTSKYMVNFPFSSQPAIPKSDIHVLYNGNCFFDVIGANFPSNPLTVGHTTLSCLSTMSLGVLSTPSLTYSPPSNPGTVIAVSSITTVVLTSIASPVTNYSINVNYCIVLNTEKNSSENILPITIFPNPSADQVTIITSKININEELKIDIKGLNGKLLFTENKNCNKDINVDMKDFAPGIYFISITGNNISHTQKIIKH